MKTIFDYLDYRRFLADYYEEKKDNNQYLLWYMGYHLKVDEKELIRIMQGNSHLREHTLPLVYTYFMFTHEEARYFRMLFRNETPGIVSDRDRMYRKYRPPSHRPRRFIEKFWIKVSYWMNFPISPVEFGRSK